MKLLLFLLGLIALAVGMIFLGQQGIGPIVITSEGQQRIILMLGNPRDEPVGPGIALRWPFIEDVRTFDARWLHLSSEPKEIQTTDRERIVVDNYVVWRISDPLLFYKSFPQGISEAKTQIGQQVRSKVREVIGQRTLIAVLKEDREAVTEEITRKSADELRLFGIDVNDVRINKTELPRGTEENVYARMRAERERLARKSRAEGDMDARRIRAEADRDATVVVAEARRQAEIERGQGDATSTRIYAEAYGADEEFYAFLRTLEAYEKTLGKGTTMVLPPSHEFFRLFQEGGAPSGSP